MKPPAGVSHQALAEALFNCFDSNSSGTLDAARRRLWQAVAGHGMPGWEGNRGFK